MKKTSALPFGGRKRTKVRRINDPSDGRGKKPYTVESKRDRAIEVLDYLESYAMGDEYEEHFLGIFGKKNKEKRRKAFKKIGGFLKKAGNAVKDAAKAVGKVITAPVKWMALMPFKGSMKKALRREGITPPRKLEDIAQRFYEVKILGKKSFEWGENHLDEKGGLEPATASMIIQAIISFFKRIVKDKNTGELSPEDQELAGLIEGAATKLLASAESGSDADLIRQLESGGEAPVNVERRAASSSGGSSDSGGLFSGGSMPLILIAVLALFVFMKND